MKKDFKMRTGLIVGQEGLDKLKDANVIVFGVGGVGSFACEALVRAGVGNITIVDFDDVDITNINRQIPALHSTIGRLKVDVMKERILSINPEVEVDVSTEFFMPGSKLLDNSLDYIVDAIDTVTGKIELVCKANELNIPIISAMGTGNKLDSTKFEVVDIYKTSVCPLANVMRKELRARGIEKLKVVYSKEEPIKPNDGDYKTPASISFVPSVAGLIIAGEVIKDIING